MSVQNSARISLTDVARAAAVSKGTASLALRNRPNISLATRERVHCAARQLGYIPDARISSWMTQVRETSSKNLLPICWLNTNTNKDAWQRYKFLSPYIDGARDRCLQLGYRLEEMWLFQPGMTVQRMSRILYERGIEGVLITQYINHIRLRWDHLAGVVIESGVASPRLHRVGIDFPFNFQLACKMVRRFGYHRVGVCLEELIDRKWNHAFSAAVRYLDEAIPVSMRVPPLFHEGNSRDSWRRAQAQVVAWVRRCKPEVIVGHASWLVECVESAGYRVPEDIGIVHIATDNDVTDWAGIYSNKRAVGATAAEMAISCIQNRQFGVPEAALNTHIRGTWRPGRTLVVPKPHAKTRRIPLAL